MNNDYLQLPISGILGLLAPMLISTLKQVTWSIQVKLLIAFGVSALFALVAALATGELGTNDYVGSLGVVFTVSSIFYQSYFAHTELNTTLEQVGAPPAPVPQVPDREAPTV